MSFEKRHTDLVDHGKELQGKRAQLLSLWQEIAENFYPERADFTTNRRLGDEFAGNLDTSYPVLARRDLGNAFGAMLRPPGKEWFKIRLKREGDEDEAARQWLEMATRVQRRAIYDRESGFVRATKEGDHDFAAFGQCAISVERAVAPGSGAVLLHRCWHLRDMWWCEDAWGRIATIYRKWKASARDIVAYFPGKAAKEVEKAAEKEPYKEFEIWHIVTAAGNYEKKSSKPYVSLYLDVDNQHLMEEVGLWNHFYNIPRWETVSGSQYAYSPATIAALPDARLIQAMTYTLLTAGERAADPPMIGKIAAIKGAVELFPGGFTSIDGDYDERLGEILRPALTGGEKSIPMGLEMTQDTRSMIAEAFYLNRLSLPPPTKDMTAYEVAQRIEEFVRANLPLFEPMEVDYNGGLWELQFDILLRGGAFGPPTAMPPSLRGQEVEARFENPLREASDRVDGQRFIEARGLLEAAAPLDPLAPKMIDVQVALRDALRGVGTPAKWMRDKDQMAAMKAEADQAAAAQAMMGQVAQGAAVAEQVGKAGQAVKDARPEPAAVP